MPLKAEAQEVLGSVGTLLEVSPEQMMHLDPAAGAPVRYQPHRRKFWHESQSKNKDGLSIPTNKQPFLPLFGSLRGDNFYALGTAPNRFVSIQY